MHVICRSKTAAFVSSPIGLLRPVGPFDALRSIEEVNETLSGLSQ